MAAPSRQPLRQLPRQLPRLLLETIQRSQALLEDAMRMQENEDWSQWDDEELAAYTAAGSAMRGMVQGVHRAIFRPDSDGRRRPNHDHAQRPVVGVVAVEGSEDRKRFVCGTEEREA